MIHSFVIQAASLLPVSTFSTVIAAISSSGEINLPVVILFALGGGVLYGSTR